MGFFVLCLTFLKYCSAFFNITAFYITVKNNNKKNTLAPLHKYYTCMILI